MMSDHLNSIKAATLSTISVHHRVALKYYTTLRWREASNQTLELLLYLSHADSKAHNAFCSDLCKTGNRLTTSH